MNDRSIFLYPKDSDDDAVALPKLRAYYASRIAHPPMCEARKYWEKFVNMADADLLDGWRTTVSSRAALMSAYRAAGH